MKTNSIGLLFILITSFVSAQEYTTRYYIDSIPNSIEFFKLDIEEKKLDSLNKIEPQKDKFGLDKSEFIKNRSRLFMNKYWNNINQEINEEGANTINFIPLFCSCEIKKDIISIETGWNYYGLVVFKTEVAKSTFQTKLKLNDETIEMEYQKLILNTQPSFKIGQQLSGLLTYKTKKIIQSTTNTIETDQTHYDGKIYFTCITHKNL